MSKMFFENEVSASHPSPEGQDSKSDLEDMGRVDQGNSIDDRVGQQEALLL